MTLKQKWNLDCFYNGGSDSPELKETFVKTHNFLKDLDRLIQKKADLKQALKITQDISSNLREMGSFICCLNAQDTSDTKAHLLQDQITSLNAQFDNHVVRIDEWLASVDGKTFKALLQDAELKPIAFSIEERRHLAQDKLSAKEESFINDLAVDGYHGWTQMWDAQIGNMTFPFKGENLSFGQIENHMADPSRENRQAAFQSIDTAFRKHQNLFAQMLNHLAGFRLAVYRKRGWASVLKEPMADNRMQEATLNAMWNAIHPYRDKLKAYLQCKADLLHLPQIHWCDLEAPLGEVTKKISYDEASAFIIKHFNQFSPQMGAFATEVLHGTWVDAENRPKKRPGGFCVGMPITQQSRIFMTYADTMTNVFTLAHELGHAFHNHITDPLPEMSQHIKMNVAETASTMAEMIVTRAAIKEASNAIERQLILDDHLSRAVAYLMNIYARFLFETRFYETRKKGFVSPETLNELMTETQKEAYGDSLGAYHPLFWAAKMHFYFAEVPFYNFPYTFGYLFSLGIHEMAHETGDFEKSYVSLLQDTGRMNVEDLAQKHLGVDLTEPTFWNRGLKTLSQDIDTFVKYC